MAHNNYSWFNPNHHLAVLSVVDSEKLAMLSRICLLGLTPSAVTLNPANSTSISQNWNFSTTECDAVVPAQLLVVECVVKVGLDAVIIEKCIIHHLAMPLHLLGDLICSLQVGVT